MAGELQTTVSFADNDQVTSAKLNEIISGASFTSDAVTGTTLTVVSGKLKVGTITSSQMGAGSVTETALGSLSVTSGKIALGAVGTTNIANLAVTGAKIAANTITFSNLISTATAGKASMENEATGFLVTPDFAKYSPYVAKAYGTIEMGSGTRTLAGSSGVAYQNIGTVIADSSTTTRVNIATDMFGDNYVVIATWEFTSGTPSAVACAVYNKTAANFYVKHAAAAAGQSLNVVVFGKLSA